MFEKAAEEVKRIVELAESCPEPLQKKAFEILLQGYVTSILPHSPTTQIPDQPDSTPTPPPPPPPPPPGDDSWREGISDDVLPRFQIMATRLKIKPEQLADVFDFSTDPFSFAAFHVAGKSTRERLYRVAMLVAVRSYLATGRWSADWSEIKAMCTHQSCYDMNNFSGNLTQAEGDWFKKVNSGENVQTAAKGQKEAERLLKVIASGSDASEE